MKTKKYEMWLEANLLLRTWALPLFIDVEYLGRDYTEIHVRILCFSFCFTKVSRKQSKIFDNMFGGDN